MMRRIGKLGLALAFLVSAGAALAQGLGSDGETFLKAVREDDPAKAMPLVQSQGRQIVNYRGYDGDTALHIATRQRALDWVGFLLGKGSDPNIGDKQGDTALIVAARMGFEEAARTYVAIGANVDAANRRGETALIAAVQQRQPRIVELLLKAGANPDKADFAAGYTARDYAKRDTRSRELLKLIETVKSTRKKAAGPSLN
jgi:ankyrin repeat protein